MKIKIKIRSREEFEEPKPILALAEAAPPISNNKRMKIVIRKKGLKMDASSFYIPKGNPVKPLGEDAHFISKEKQTIGVADGVGGWAHQGIDSGIFARSLMQAASLQVQSHNNHDDPKRILLDAFPNTVGIDGASTACILTHSNGILRCANVGDSGFMLFRQAKLLHCSQPQQRHFNCPFQLGNHSTSDRPHSAAETHVSVQAGDIVVLATDGLLDNMFHSDIEAIIANYCKGKDTWNINTEVLACKIAQEAYYKSIDKYFPSPFAINSAKLGKKHQGGKQDDITVVVAKIFTDYDLQHRPITA